jgi:hypothetical protein
MSHSDYRSRKDCAYADRMSARHNQWRYTVKLVDNTGPSLLAVSNSSHNAQAKSLPMPWQKRERKKMALAYL